MRIREVTDKDRENIGLPKPMFLYTIEQVCMFLALSQESAFKKVFWLNGREVGRQPRDKIRCINIAENSTDTPIWRVEEMEFVRWARFKEFRTFQ